MRRKISRTRAIQEERARHERAKAPPSTFPGLSREMRQAVGRRDHYLCGACHESGPKLVVYTFLAGSDDLNELERDHSRHALLCTFCRSNADTMQASSLKRLLGIS